jgi:hypothetical protein
VDKRDIITFLVAIGIVAGIAMIINPPDFGDGDTSISGAAAGGDTCTDSSCCTAGPHYTYSTTPLEPPFRIFYNYDIDSIYSPGPSGYPRLHLPKNLYLPESEIFTPEHIKYHSFSDMDRYLSSDLFSSSIWGNKNVYVKKFAYMNGNYSGYSEVFGVPYDLWRINSKMNPAKGQNLLYSSFQWILVDASTGDIVTGGNIQNNGSIVRKVESGDRKYYFIIEAENILDFELNLETPETSYYQQQIQPEMYKIKDMLSTMD